MESYPAPDEKARQNALFVLFLEDCSEDIELCLRTLRSSNFYVNWDAAVTPGELVERARTMRYDVILSDYRMPGFTGMDVFEALRSEGIRTPFILVTGSLGDEHAVECLKRGVSDYVLKDRLARLPVAIRRTLEEERIRLEKARVEEALRSSEASYRSLTQSAPCGILRISTLDGRLLETNTALALMLGYNSPSDLLRDSSAGSIGLHANSLSRLIADGDPGRNVECEVEWKCEGGAKILIRLSGRVRLDENGSPTCLEMIAENITERHAAQKRIQQLNQLYSVLIHAGEAIVRTRESSSLLHEICRIIVEDGGFQMAWVGLLEPETQVVRPCAWYPTAVDYVESLHVTTRPEASGLGPIGAAIRENRHVVCNDLVVDPSMAPWRERALRHSFHSLAAFPILNRGRAIGAITIYAADVDFFGVENVTLLDELAGNISFALESIDAVHLHERVSDELHQFFALSLDMLCITNLEGYIQRLNPAWEKTLGFSEAELCSKPWMEFVHPEDRQHALEALAAFRGGVEVTHLELRFLSKSGDYRWLILSATPALDRGVVFAAVTDITSRRHLEDQLRSQNLKLEEHNQRVEAASRMKSEFLANMSHELRSPLNGIIGFSELLYDGKLGAIPDRPKEFIGRVHASASHLLQLINGVLDLSKIEAGHLEFCPEPLFVSDIVQEVTGILSSQATKKQIRIETEIEPGVDEVNIDPGRLRQVLYNYLSNALKFTGERGLVVVRLKSEGSAHFRLEVSDTGIGVSKEDIGRLFVEFQQLDATVAKRYQGTGLGLALTRRIVEAQGGRVGVTSKLGQGSTFFAVLPRGPIPPWDHDRAPKILVIDDQSLDRSVVTHILKAKGYRTDIASTCAEAQDKCVRERFDAITLDLMLPDGAGWEVLARIRSLEYYDKVPVIVISGCNDVDRFIPLEVQGYLAKPVDPDGLMAALQHVGIPARVLELTNG